MKTSITENVKRLLEELPEHVLLVAAAKSRTADEIDEAIEAGIRLIGENYVQEALAVIQAVKNKAEWHFIGHLQKNKVKYVVPNFDMIESVDSVPLAREIDKRCNKLGKRMPVLVEINSGREPQKFGFLPEEAENGIREIATLENIKILGLMTMGPRTGDPEAARPYFVETKKLFDKIGKLNIPNVEMRYLSMGMTNSYRIAVQEGANIVRIGTLIFGRRGKPI